MPVIAIPVHRLRDLIGRAIPNQELVTLCQRIGCDVEELTVVKRVKCIPCGYITEHSRNEKRPERCEICASPFEHQGTAGDLPDLEVLRIDLLPNRPDNFDVAGLARTLRGYLGIETGLPSYPTVPGTLSVTVDPGMASAESFRPFLACAAVEHVILDEDSLKSLMKLQENLHWALGRNRKHASIGVYDLAALTPPIRYRPMEPEFSFTPLGEKLPHSLQSILCNTQRGKDFAHLLAGMLRYPMLLDAKDRVLSMPPVINSEETRVTTATTSLFIDVTGTVESTVEKALNIVVCSLRELVPTCTVTTVRIDRPEGTRTYPNLSPETHTLELDYARRLLGAPLESTEIHAALERMRYKVVKEEEGRLELLAPAYRNDLMHACDLIEDLAIGHGYQNLTPQPVTTATIGQARPMAPLLEAVRNCMTGLGFLELTTIILTSEDRAFHKLGLQVPDNLVILDNPISVEQTIARSSILPGLLETFALNKDVELPQRLFEVGEILEAIPGKRDETLERYFLAGGIIAPRAGFSDIKQSLSTLLAQLGLTWDLAPHQTPLYLPGRAATLLLVENGTPYQAGHLGEVHPEVLERFGLGNPVVLFEFDLSRVQRVRT